MKKRNDGGQLRLDSFMETRDPKIKRYYFDALEEEGPAVASGLFSGPRYTSRILCRKRCTGL